MSLITPCVQGWIDDLTPAAKAKLQGALEGIIDEPFEDFENLSAVIGVTVDDLNAQVTELQSRVVDLEEIKSLLPTPGACPELDAQMTDLIDSSVATLSADATALTDNLRGYGNKITELDNKVDDIKDRATEATDFKFW